MNVAENQTAVVDVQSTDPDGETEGAGLTYQLLGGADKNLFNIVAGTGVLTFKVPPDFENPQDAGGNNVYDVQVTLSDSGGLTASQSVAVSIINVDESPPVLSNVPGNQPVEAASSAGATVHYTLPTATDDTDPSPTVACDHSSGETFPLGVTTVNCTATDDAGNFSPGSFTVAVTDTTSPTITKLELVPVGKKIGRVVLTFSEDVQNAAVASNYTLVSVKKGKIKPVPLASLGSAAYSSAAHTLTFTPAKALAAKKLGSLRLTVLGSGTLADLAGNLLDGNSDGAVGGDCTTGIATRTNPCAPVASAVQSATDEVLSSRATPHRLRSEILVDDFLGKRRGSHVVSLSE